MLHSRQANPSPALVDVAGVSIGDPAITIIAGPCSIESRDMLLNTAHAVRDAGACILRGGAFKPRTSPYSFRGLGDAALEMLVEAREQTGMPVVTEVMDTRDVERVAAVTDMLQIGARNMQNFALLAEVGDTRIPVLLKRGFAATISELLWAAEHILARGNTNVVLCERGIRTFETAVRNTLDISAIPLLKAESHLPVIVDPSHAGGRASLVTPLSLAAIAAGADGLMVEVHPDPSAAKSDGEQSLTFDQFAETMSRIRQIARATGRHVAAPALDASPIVHPEAVRWSA